MLGLVPVGSHQRRIHSPLRPKVDHGRECGLFERVDGEHRERDEDDGNEFGMTKNRKDDEIKTGQEC